MARSTAERPPVAAHVGRLVGDARVKGAIGQGGDRPPAAKEEFGLAGIADRPAAGLLGQFEQGPALTHGNHVVDEFRLRLSVEVIGMGERGVAADGRARDPHHVLVRTRLARPRRRRGRRFGATRKPEPVHLADHGIAGDAAQLGGDLAGRQPVDPQPLERLDAFISPSHGLKSLASRRGEIRTESTCGRGTDALPLTPNATTMYASDLPPHDMSYLLIERLQYGESQAQESEVPASTCSSTAGALHPHLSAWRPGRPRGQGAIPAPRIMLTVDVAAIKYQPVPPGEAAHFI